MAHPDDSAQLGREFAWFTAVGAIGFAIDAALFLLLNGGFDWPIVGARLISASCAIATTWALNRRLTFAQRRSPGRGAELLRYALVQTAGLVVNFGVFGLALWLAPPLRSLPIAALALGAAAALAFNFVSARALAFRGPATR
jgi:putative flippase GtrA